MIIDCWCESYAGEDGQVKKGRGSYQKRKCILHVSEVRATAVTFVTCTPAAMALVQPSLSWMRRTCECSGFALLPSVYPMRGHLLQTISPSPFQSRLPSPVSSEIRDTSGFP